jgi:molybdenum cofactor cytidylyltransferase
MADPTPRDSRSVYEKTAALIVAAGGAVRMGRPKALLPWLGESLLRRAVKAAAACPCDPIHVVVGCRGDALVAELEGLDVAITRNEGWADGIGSSISAGISDLPNDCSGVLLMLCDQPFVTPELLSKLLEVRARRDTPIVASRYGSTLGPPAYFDASLFGKLAVLEGDRGAKSILLENSDSVATVEFAKGEIDIDTPEDYSRALDMLEPR